jgi:5'-nucleotidase
MRKSAIFSAHWFSEGSVFREVDVSTGNLKLGIHLGPMKRGKVLSGGSCEAFIRLMKARGKEVLYTGDHIFGDVLKSKKSRGWRTFLIIPELEHELIVWTERHSLFDQIAEIDLKLAERESY